MQEKEWATPALRMLSKKVYQSCHIMQPLAPVLALCHPLDAALAPPRAAGLQSEARRQVITLVPGSWQLEKDWWATCMVGSVYKTGTVCTSNALAAAQARCEVDT